MIRQRLYSIISEDDDEEQSIISMMERDLKKTIEQKQDEVYKMYKNLFKKKTNPKQKQDHTQSLNKLNQKINSIKQRNETIQTTNKSFKRNLTLDSSNRKPKINNEQISSISSSKVVSEKEVKQKLITNYSQGYKQNKPFNFKSRQRTTTVYQQQDVQIPPSPQISVKQSTRQHFLKRLQKYTVKDKMQEPYNHHHSNFKIKKFAIYKLQDKKLRDELRYINQQQSQIQQSIRSYHLQYKQYCNYIKNRYNINAPKSNQILKAKIKRQIIALPKKQSTELPSKKRQIINEYKQFYDKIESDIRKIDYLVQIMKQNVRKAEIQAEQNKIHSLLFEPISYQEEIQKQIKRPIVEGPTYKQIMKARRNKDFYRARQLVQEKCQSTDKQANILNNSASSSEYRQYENGFENQSGRIKVNHNLRNLLLS